MRDDTIEVHDYKPVEIGHEGLHSEFWVDGRLEMQHRCIGVLCYSLKYLIPEIVNYS